MPDNTHYPDGHDTWRIFRIMAEFVDGFEAMSDVGPAVSIFGSARNKPGDPFYDAAEKTAALLAKEKFAVITGGGPGIMEAGNKGAFNAGGKSIGLNITLPHEQMSNPYQTLGMDFHYFYVRKVMFVKYAVAFICFPGGFGTMDEFFETATLIQTMKSRPFPVILYGAKFWGALVDWMRANQAPHYIDPLDLEIFRIADSPEEAVKLVKEGSRQGWWHPPGRQIIEPEDRTPAGSSATTESGEGTVYGKRATRPPRLPQPPKSAW
ncbi:MAG TPA: TIGR00730 family Rossman fold protein [Tepidisphaeraceae bacterium]|nr:TIGR00730 family Rossman fold protein [Tepidisphaeraceae bacterium]